LQNAEELIQKYLGPNATAKQRKSSSRTNEDTVRKQPQGPYQVFITACEFREGTAVHLVEAE